MKIFSAILISVVVIISCFSNAFAEAAPDKVVAFYFHGSFRCSTCANMEKYTKEALEENFKNEIASGKLEFRGINVEDGGNEHFIKDYQLYTKSLILSLEKGGREVRYKNLEKIWEFARNKIKFIDYVKAETAEFIAEAE